MADVAPPSPLERFEEMVVTEVYRTNRHDLVTLEVLRDQLVAERRQRGWTHVQAAAQIGRSPNLLYEMENLKSGLRMSSVQAWASMYDLRVEFQLEDFWNFTWPHDETYILYMMSRPFDAADYQRLWLVAALQAWREKLGVTCMEVSYWLGLKSNAVSEWERKASDPTMLRVMAQARVLDTAVTMKLWKREDWMFR